MFKKTSLFPHDGFPNDYDDITSGGNIDNNNDEHVERDIEATEELLKRGLNFVNDNNNSDGRGASEERIESSQ